VRLNKVFLPAFLVFALGSPALATEPSAAEKAVKDLGERMESCFHWYGEPTPEGKSAYADQRSAEIERAVKELRCDDLKADASKLWKLYAEDSALRKALIKQDGIWRTGMGEPLIAALQPGTTNQSGSKWEKAPAPAITP